MKQIILLLCLTVFACKSDGKIDSDVSENVEEIAESDMTKSVNDLELEVHDFNSLKKYLNTTDNKTYVVNFWATWCAPCIKELPYFERLNKEYKDKNVEVLLVSLDFPSKYETKLKPYIIENNLKSKVVALDDVDANSWIPQVSKEWTGAIPATLIFNKNERTFYEGSFDYESLLKEVKPFIN